MCRQSLGVLFEEISELTYAELRYYYIRRVSSRGFSQLCRFLAWALASIGILVPLLQPVLKAAMPESFLSWGYIAFGAAGIILIADNVFAGTEAHKRYSKTQFEIERLYTIFALEWQTLLAKHDATATLEITIELINKGVEYVKDFHLIMGTETSDWQKALDAGISELRGKVSAAEKSGK